MKIGILGSGMVGQALAAKAAELGHQVKIATRTPDKLAEWKQHVGPNVAIGTFAETASFGEFLVLATKWEDQDGQNATEQVIKLAEAKNFAGKAVIDTINPISRRDGKMSLSVGPADSAGELIQRWLPEAHIVKALNIVGYKTMVNPSLPDGDPDMFIAGNDSGAKQTVTALLTEFGWKTIIDLGSIEAARYLESMAMIWVMYMAQHKTREHAFKLIGK